MNAHDTIKQSILKYPSLYNNKLDVYDHLFLTNGNGFEWVNGELVSKENENGSLYSTEDAIAKIFSHTRLEERARSISILFDFGDISDTEYFNKILFRLTDSLKREVEKVLPDNVERMMNDMSVIKDKGPVDNTNLYPLCKYAKIMNIPDNVTESWKEALREFYNWLMSCDDELVVQYRKENAEYIEKIETYKFL